ncbi:MAG: DUF1629 domain-containing protein [Hyphomicrobiales bacterium]
MTQPSEARKTVKAKQEFLYFIEARWTSFGSGIHCVNERELFRDPLRGLTKSSLRLSREESSPMQAVPLMQFSGKADKYHDDLEIIWGIWIMSPAVRAFFERIDPGAFTFMECRTQYPDGSTAPPRSLAVVIREVDAFDREKSEFFTNPYNPEKNTAILSVLNRNYFRKSAVGSFHIFVAARTSGEPVVSQAVRDEFKKQRWRGATFAKAYLS